MALTAEELKTLRESCGLTERQAAGLVYCSDVAWFDWELGKCSLSEPWSEHITRVLQDRLPEEDGGNQKCP